jgi:methylated-DNA-[protein]-cysteine S-methyltransferase
VSGATASVRAYRTTVPSPLGPLRLVATADALTEIWLPGETPSGAPDPVGAAAPPPLAEARRQLEAYFAGDLREFDLPLAPAGTPFQREVWERLRAIPYGRTVSYGELARRLGRPDAVRAVGAANGRNPLPIVIPCHRVIGSDGRLVGYGGGLAAKAMLLDHEQRVAAGQGSLFGPAPAAVGRPGRMRPPAARRAGARPARPPGPDGRQPALFAPPRPGGS